MADNLTRIVISAVDQASAALNTIGKNVGALNLALGGMGATLASTLSIGGMAALAKASIDAADAMNDLSQRVGVGIKDLAAWQLAANQSGTSLEAVAKGIKGLSSYIVDHRKELQAAGITATDANEALLQLADLFQALPDGVEKTALATKLMGKAGMEMIPVLNMGSAGLADARAKSQAYAEQLAKIAPQADQFNDLLGELSLQSKALGMNIAEYFLPGLIGVAQWLNDIAAGGVKAQQALAWMTSDRTVTALTLMGHPLLTRGASRSASGKIGGQSTGLSPADELALGNQNEAILRAQILRGEEVAKAAKAAQDAALARMLALGQKNLAGSLDSEEDMRLLAEKRAIDDAKKAYKDLTDTIEAATKAQAEHTKTLGEQVAAAERALETYGLTESQIADLTIARLNHARAMEAEQDADEVTLARYDREIDAMQRIRVAKQGIELRDTAKKAAEDAARAWQDFARDLESSLTDALMRGFENGNSFGENFVKTLQNTLKTAALKVVVQAMVNPIMGGISSALGGGGSGGGMNLPFGGGGSLYGSFATSDMGAALGLSEATDFTGALTLSESGMAIGSALPYVGWGMAALSMLGAFEGDGLAQRTGQFVSPFAKSNAMGPSQFGAMPDGSRYNWANNHWFSGDMAPGQDQFDAALQDAEQAMINKLGLTAAQIAAIDAQIAGLDGKVYNFGTEHTDQAASGVFEAIKADRMQAIATGLGMTLQELTDQMSGAAKTAKELAAETEKLAAEQNKAKAQALLGSIGATLSGIDAVTGLRSGLMSAMAGVRGGNTYDSRMAGLQALLAGETDLGRQVALAGQIKDLVLERYQAERAAIEQNQAAAEQAAEAMRAGLRAIGDHAKSLLVGDLSPLTAGQQLAEAGSQYQATLARARGGDLAAVGSLSGAASTYLAQARGYYASGGDYRNIFGEVQHALTIMGLGADAVTDTTNWQAQLLAVDNEALASLGRLATTTEDWTLNLENLLIDQTRQFEALGVKLADVADNTRGLDARIAVLLDAALAARFDKLSAAVEKSATTTARAVTNAVQVAIRA